MLDWLSVVRMAEQDSIRWVLAALPERQAEKPVGVRRGNQWIARLVDEGLLQRAQPALNDRSIIWATHRGIGRVAPNLYRQTTRHEIAVAAISAGIWRVDTTGFETGNRPGCRIIRPATPRQRLCSGLVKTMNGA